MVAADINLCTVELPTDTAEYIDVLYRSITTAKVYTCIFQNTYPGLPYTPYIRSIRTVHPLLSASHQLASNATIHPLIHSPLHLHNPLLLSLKHFLNYVLQKSRVSTLSLDFFFLLSGGFPVSPLPLQQTKRLGHSLIIKKSYAHFGIAAKVV